ncbi:GDSL esterase/lipase [Phytophthora citrophthora]|uniref:GDSL esterase/lipase n=1 Tax=Phytophthora citrophthora TaxID=4793 RepID=A0AAD9LCA4_9STRA|nr:GDSL esterase/lipase [Phytophthora citrophthora]
MAPRTVQCLSACFVLVTVFISSTTSQTTPNTYQTGSRPVLLLTGDSLTERGTFPSLQGWVSILQARYTRSADIITRGLSGYNTKWFLKNVTPTLEHEITTSAYSSPSLITVWLGTNDATLTNGSNANMHVPINEYKENLVKIVVGFQNVASKAKVLLITPPHIGDAARIKYAAERTDAKRGLVDRSNAAAGKYSRACVEVANSLNVPVLDLYAHFNAMSVETRDGMLADGIHFNAAGNKVVDEQLQKKLSTEFPELIDSLNNWQFPAVSKFQAEDPWTPNYSVESSN